MRRYVYDPSCSEYPQESANFYLMEYSLGLFGGITPGSSNPNYVIEDMWAQPHASVSLLRFMMNWEGFSASSYDDGFGNMTIGWGHLIVPGEEYLLSKTLTHLEAFNLFLSDVQNKAESYVRKFFQDLDNEYYPGEATGYQLHRNIPLTQSAFDALIDFTYNLGSKSFMVFMEDKVKTINGNPTLDLFQLATDIANMGGAGGLTIRREQERRMMLEGIYDSSH